ncbi:MAG: hypothetical protein K9K93_07035 [Acholeplasmataceae bacterium]|nr:hypothetical protein [Acholeplasmataceae bacterium]
MRRSPKRVYMWIAVNLAMACLIALMMVMIDSRHSYTLSWSGWYWMIGLILLFLVATLTLLIMNRDMFKAEAQKAVIKRFNRRLYDIERSPEAINRVMRARTYEFEFKEDRLVFSRGIEPNVETFVVMMRHIIKVTVRRVIYKNAPIFTLLVRYHGHEDEDVLSIPLIPDFYHLFKVSGIQIENDTFLNPDSVYEDAPEETKVFRFIGRIIFYKSVISLLVVVIMGSLASVLSWFNDVPYIILTVMILVPMWFESRTGGRLSISSKGVSIMRRLGVDVTWDDILEVTIDEKRKRITFLTYAGPFQFRYHPDMKAWIEKFHVDKTKPKTPEDLAVKTDESPQGEYIEVNDI